MPGLTTISDKNGIFAARLIIAAIQGIFVYLLIESAQSPVSWPADSPAIFDPALLIGIFIPPLLIQAWGQIEGKRLALWGAMAAGVIALLGAYQNNRGYIDNYHFMLLHCWPLFAPAVTMGLFVTHALIMANCRDRRLLARYTSYFDTAWKLCLQLILSVLFIGAFWLLLFLASELFRIIDIVFFRDLIEKRWFNIPATALAASVAIHVTDAESGIINSARSLLLTLLSWLLPVLTIFIALFLVMLPFSSMSLLLRTHWTGTIMLWSSAWLVLLINSFYQDGTSLSRGVRFHRLCAAVAAVELTPLTIIAAWAIIVRVAQYGLTVDRIFALAGAAISTIYAVGYGAAILTSVQRKEDNFSIAEKANIVASYAMVALLVALFSPLADPARLMVDDQIARLKSGRITIDRLDFVSLRFDGVKWGRDALHRFSHDSDASIADRANNALNAPNRYALAQFALQPAPGAWAEEVTVVPAGATLPAEFTRQDFLQRSFGHMIFCQKATQNCVAKMLSLPFLSGRQILFLEGSEGAIFTQDDGGGWKNVAFIDLHPPHGRCDDSFAPSSKLSLAEGDVHYASHPLPDLVIGHHTYTLTPDNGCDGK